MQSVTTFSSWSATCVSRKACCCSPATPTRARNKSWGVVRRWKRLFTTPKRRGHRMARATSADWVAWSGLTVFVKLPQTHGEWLVKKQSSFDHDPVDPPAEHPNASDSQRRATRCIDVARTRDLTSPLSCCTFVRHPFQAGSYLVSFAKPFFASFLVPDTSLGFTVRSCKNKIIKDTLERNLALMTQLNFELEFFVRPNNLLTVQKGSSVESNPPGRSGWQDDKIGMCVGSDPRLICYVTQFTAIV